MASLRRMSDSQLRGVVHKERAKLQRIKDAAPHLGTDPKKTPKEQKAQKDYVLRIATEARARFDAANAELIDRKNREPKRTLSDRLAGRPGLREQQKIDEEREERQIAERVEFIRQMKEASDERNEAELQCKREAGRVYESVNAGGGFMVAALFSSATLWDFTERKLREDPDNPGKYVTAQILTHRHINMLFWASNLIESMGGEEARFPNGQVWHWTCQDGEIGYRDSDLAHLVKTEFLEVEKGIGSGSLTTIRYGSRSKEILAGFMEMLAAAKKAA